MEVLTVVVLTKVQCTPPLSEGVPFCKTGDEGVDGHDIDEGPVREVEFLGGFLELKILHLDGILEVHDRICMGIHLLTGEV
jgi:hypothetical protein